MARKRHKPEEIVAKLRQVDVLTGQGKSIAEAVKTIAVTETTYFRWRAEYGESCHVKFACRGTAVTWQRPDPSLHAPARAVFSKAYDSSDGAAWQTCCGRQRASSGSAAPRLRT